jgi:hypothetical protein
MFQILIDHLQGKYMIKILETTEAFHICDQGCGLGKQNF